MRKLLPLLSLVIATHAGATVINFDDVSGALPATYQGLNWSGPWNVESNGSFAGYGNTYGAPSGTNAVFNGGGVLQVSLGGTTAFNFDGAYFTGWASNNNYAGYTSTSITVKGYDAASNLVDSVTMNLSANKYDWLDAHMAGVSTLEFYASGSSKWWLMDNLTINEASNVPEPATLSMLGLGLFGLGAARRRMAKKNAA